MRGMGARFHIVAMTYEDSFLKSVCSLSGVPSVNLLQRLDPNEHQPFYMSSCRVLFPDIPRLCDQWQYHMHRRDSCATFTAATIACSSAVR